MRADSRRRAERREVVRLFKKELAETADQLDLTTEQVLELRNALPYSTIPTLQDLVYFVDALEEHGWRRLPTSADDGS